VETIWELKSMSDGAPWAAHVELADASGLADLRLLPGLEIAQMAHVYWLRGPAWDSALGLALRRVSGLRVFRVLPDGALLRQGARVPEGRLPELRWEPLRIAAAVQLAAPLPGGVRPSPVSLRLVRTSVEQPARGLLTDAPSWRDWADRAPNIRLQPLRFAAARDGRVWIEGAPISTLSGQRFQVAEGVGVPCGFTWQPAIDAQALARWLGLAKGDAALASTGSEWEIIKDEQFVPATRSGARLTAEALQGHA
jgi:MoxR-vWA-beta-propeller ternary system domain bpX2